MSQGNTDRVYDELLVTLVREGNLEAGERLASRWQPRLLRTARRLLKLDDPAKFPAWAYSILHRKCADRIRTAQRVRAHEMDAMPDIAVKSGVESAVSIAQALPQLSPEMRVAAILYFSEGLTLTEIATATDVPVGTAKSRIFHARQRLKAILDGETL